MKIINARRMSQFFFFALFMWFCVVATVGSQFHQLNGWPVNMFLYLDPLVAISTILSTHSLYAPLLLSLATIITTLLLGRIFCGFVCPFGALHQFVGYLANRKRKVAKKIDLNKYRNAQKIKYYILVILLITAAVPALNSLQIGLLDPIPLITRTFNIALLPIADNPANTISINDRNYEFVALIGIVFLAAVFMNLYIPRFFCRFVCPLGALLALFSKFSFFRIGKRSKSCPSCKLCERNCEGACHPAGNIYLSECVSCFNCLDDCKHDLITYKPAHPLGPVPAKSPDLNRRGLVLSAVTAITAIPFVRLAAKNTVNYSPSLIRPPGSLDEQRFLERCLKCGQCMRVCPTNVIQPAGLEHGFEALWTPTLNNRIGTSGCQLNCTECGNICPTAAIRPISIDEKIGRGKFEEKGPIKMGTAFVDRSRCLVWAFDKPCLVCQENCPVSPKAITTVEEYRTVNKNTLTITDFSEKTVQISPADLEPEKYSAGDYFLAVNTDNGTTQREKITANTEEIVNLADTNASFLSYLQRGKPVNIQLHLSKPVVDINKCIGCGVCEHECPVTGKRAIRVTAEGESRNKERKLLPEN